jgi:N-acetylglucosaminyldiphosphoundecaprenol N-acetyl-beta-D-mannosaminyltransferase
VSSPETPIQIARYLLAGVPIDAVSTETLSSAVQHFALLDDGAPRIIANQNLHGMYFVPRSEGYRRLTSEATIVHVDGMGVVLLGRLFGLPLKRVHRTTYADWIWDLMRLAEANRFSVYFLGGTREANDRAGTRLREMFPAVTIHGHHGYLNDEDDAAVLEGIAAARPHLLFVGMGMPRQEEWVLRNRDSISASVVLMAGACVDYVAGKAFTPPRWSGRFGLEWLFRLASDPRRLANRYLIEPWFVLGAAIRERRKTTAEATIRSI